MSEETYRRVVWGILILGSVAWMYFLTGCASREEVAPIQYYRLRHGFPTGMLNSEQREFMTWQDAVLRRARMIANNE